MTGWKRNLAAVGTAAALGAVFAAVAMAAGAKTLYTDALYGNIPNVTVRGVAAGGAPWVVKGSATVTATGIEASGTGLVVPPGYMATGKPVAKALVGTTVGVPAVAAELSCGQGTSVLTAAAPLSKSGAFRIDAKVKVPVACTDPIVLVGPVAKGKMVAWFASTDFLTYGLTGKSMTGWTSLSGGAAKGKSAWSG